MNVASARALARLCLRVFCACKSACTVDSVEFIFGCLCAMGRAKGACVHLYVNERER